MVVRQKTFIAAPPEVCFDLARNAHAHVHTAARTRERLVTCRPDGMLELGDEVEFEAVHFRVRQRLRSRIVEYERPTKFVDEMQRGAFKRLRHLHEFRPAPGGTIMFDVLDFASPLGLLGAIVDRLVLARYMRRFLAQRNRELKKLAEERSGSYTAASQPPNGADKPTAK